MSTSEQAQPAQAPTTATGPCPFDHKSLLWPQTPQRADEIPSAIERAPTVRWNEHITGYELRDFIIALG